MFSRLTLPESPQDIPLPGESILLLENTYSHHQQLQITSRSELIAYQE